MLRQPDKPIYLRNVGKKNYFDVVSGVVVVVGVGVGGCHHQSSFAHGIKPLSNSDRMLLAPAHSLTLSLFHFVLSILFIVRANFKSLNSSNVQIFIIGIFVAFYVVTVCEVPKL